MEKLNNSYLVERVAVENSNKCNELGAEIEDLKREMFDLHPGDEILVLGDKERGIAVLPKGKQQDYIKHIFTRIDE